MLLLILALALPQEKPYKRYDTVDLFDYARAEATRKIEYRQALLGAKATGNNLGPKDLLAEHDRARERYLGSKIEGFVIVLRVDSIARENKGRYILCAVDGIPSEQFRCFADAGDDPMLRALKYGDRIRVNGEFRTRLDQIEDCTFTLANVGAKAKGKGEKAKVEKPKASDEEKAQGRLKVGTMLIKDGKSDEGRFRLESLIKEFPKTAAAVKAKAILQQ